MKKGRNKDHSRVHHARLESLATLLSYTFLHKTVWRGCQQVRSRKKLGLHILSHCSPCNPCSSDFLDVSGNLANLLTVAVKLQPLVCSSGSLQMPDNCPFLVYFSLWTRALGVCAFPSLIAVGILTCLGCWFGILGKIWNGVFLVTENWKTQSGIFCYSLAELNFMDWIEFCVFLSYEFSHNLLKTHWWCVKFI